MEGNKTLQELDTLLLDEEETEEFIRYNRAFWAKMSLADEELRDFYNALKNDIMAYKGVKNRLSWCYDSFNKGRNQLMKINVRGNGLIVYLGLNPNHYEGTKYRFRDVGYKKKYEQVPMQIKIRSQRGLHYAVELIADMMADLGILKGVVGNVNYAPEKHTLEELMAMNLVREVNADDKNNLKIDDLQKEVAATMADTDMPQEVDTKEADIALTDCEALGQLEAEKEVRRLKGTKKAVVNIDVIGRAFEADSVVDIFSLIANKLVPANTGWVKVCARGKLDKPLTIKVNDFSVIAIKMIVLMGGRAIKIK